jgi:hypothetical protein
MRILSLCCRGISLALAAILFATPKPVLADTYQIFNLGSDQNYFFYGMDDFGLVVISNPVVPMCGYSTCYYTFMNGISTGYSSIAPTSVYYNVTDTCSPSVPPGGIVLHGVCNNGREAFTGFLTPGQVIPDVYTGPDPVTDFLAHGGEGFIFMNSLGDIVWDDHFTENWYLAINTTSAVPEPNSLFLLGTGVLAAMGVMRRRLFN